MLLYSATLETKPAWFTLQSVTSLPFSVIMCVVPTVLRPYTDTSLLSLLKMRDWHFLGLEGSAHELSQLSKNE